jgi:EAL domain-containing protein (putative c-di-GMP-specific phosphodiesterase class I)
MNSRSESISVSRHPRRLALGELEGYVRGSLRNQPSQRRGMLVLGISRSDRVRALIGLPSALQVQDEMLDSLEAGLRAEVRYVVATPEEIWVWLDNAPNESICRLAAHAIRERLDGAYQCRLDDGNPSIVRVDTVVGGTFNLDISTATSDLFQGLGSLLAAATAANDRIAIIASNSDQERRLSSNLEPLLRRALEANELEVHYQPIINLADMRCSGLEALVRWPKPPGLAPVSAPILVSICEKAGMIDELTRFVLNTAMRHLADWTSAGLTPDVSINLSALSLSNSTFPTLVEETCDIWGISPTKLCFELTEGSIARNNRASLEFMHQIRGQGCRLSIDDFGTGYSSFAYLRQFPVDELKIDKSFMQDIAGSSPDPRIVKVLVEIAHAFGLTSVAEGVENAAALANLIDIGCDSVQGWHFAKAMPNEDIAEWIRGFNSRPWPAPRQLRMA